MTPRNDALAFDQMAEAANRAVRYAVGSSPDGLASDSMRADAILRSIGVLGEAAGRVRPDVRKTLSIHIPAMMPALVEAQAQMTADQPPPPEATE